MDALVRRLREKLRKHPDNDVLQQALSACTAPRDSPGGDEMRNAESALDRLRAEGLWDADDQALWEGLEQSVAQEEPHGSTTSTSEVIAAEDTGKAPDTAPLTAYPVKETPRFPFSFATPAALPMELYGVLNQAYYLHTLALDPQTLLPAGKSLLSVLSRPHTDHPPNSALHDRVENLVHRAFWDEVLEALSNPSPPVQLARLKGLYKDLHVALSPLLPTGHPILFTLSAPLSPTSAPLRSAVIHLREVLEGLRQRCAPARDPQIDALFRIIEDSPDDALPKAIVDVIRSLMKLADEMKDDLSQFVLGSMSERQLRDVVVKQAAANERELVLQLWKQETLRDLWKQWLDEVNSQPLEDASELRTHHRFLQRLMRAVGTNQAVSCNLPTVSVTVSSSGTPQLQPSLSEQNSLPPNSLPPPLLFITPTLFYIQNYIQALVIAASLRSLVRIPTTPAKRKADEADNEDMSEGGFLKRIWTLLKADIDGDDTGLKLVNLADEVVRISQIYGGTLDGAHPGARESQLREAVDRTLKPTDPVFLLLQKRLVDAITAHLLAHTPTRVPDSSPREMRTGRGSKKTKLVLEAEDAANEHGRLEFARESLSVKGFEHPVLSGAVADLVLMLRKCIAWTELVWPDLLPPI